MMHSKRWQHWLLAACCAWAPAVAVAQVEAGSEGMITEDGDYPTLAARGSAHALAWKDGDYGIWGCLFRPDTVIEFGAGAANATLPQLGMDAEGDLVLAWQGTDGAGAGVFARRFRASGALQGSEFRVNRTTAGNQTKPRLAVAPGGSFAIGWEDGVQGHDALRIAGFGADGHSVGRPLVLRTAGPTNLLGGVGASDQGFAAGWTEVRQCTGGALDLTAAVATFTSAMRQQGNVQRFNDGSHCSAGPTLAGMPSSELGPLAVMDGHQLTIQRFAPVGGTRIGARTVVADFDDARPPVAASAWSRWPATIAGAWWWSARSASSTPALALCSITCSGSSSAAKAGRAARTSRSPAKRPPRSSMRPPR